VAHVSRVLLIRRTAAARRFRFSVLKKFILLVVLTYQVASSGRHLDQWARLILQMRNLAVSAFYL
jgi:hypothetical protein